MTQDQLFKPNNSYSEEYRHECEVRFVSTLCLQKRREYLLGVLEKRGQKAQDRLKEGLEILWKKKSIKA
jgi:hypothetical protein